MQGGTAVWAEEPDSAPDYIFPFLSTAYFGVDNIDYFTQLMYRPLYWFGSGGRPVLNPALSLADPPTFHGRNVTITLKHYRWSNGTPVTAQNVVFWLHMMLAVPKDWGGCTGFPQNVTEHQGGRPGHADHDHEAGVLADLVPLQRAEPGHPDARGLGPHRPGARPTAPRRSGTARRCITTWTPRPRTSTATCRRRSGRSWTGRGG